MGAALEYAALLGQQLMIYVFSDGSVSSNGVLEGGDGRGKGIWKSDNSGTASVFILVYDPAGRPAGRDKAVTGNHGARSGTSLEESPTR